MNNNSVFHAKKAKIKWFKVIQNMVSKMIPITTGHTLEKIVLMY